MNTDKLQQIDELLTQIAEDAIALASDVTKLKAKREQIELQLQNVAEQQAPQEFFTKLHNFAIFTDGEFVKLDEATSDFIAKQNAQYMTRATPELAEHDAIALHNYARLLAYRAEHWPDFVISGRISESCYIYKEDADSYEVCRLHNPSILGYPDVVLFPREASDQLQQALDNGLLVRHKQSS